MEFSFRRSVIISCRLACLCCSWGYCVLFEGNEVICQGLLIYYTVPSLIRMFLQAFFCIHVSYKQRNRISDLPRYISSVIQGQVTFSPVAGTPSTTVRPVSFISRPVPRIWPARAFCRTLVGRNSLRFASHEIRMI